MAENESLIAVPKQSDLAAAALPAPEGGDWLVPAQADAPVIEQADPQVPAEAESVDNGGVKPLGLVTPTH